MNISDIKINLLPPRNVCVYTILVGDYEELNEQPIADQSTIPFICLTDNAELRSNSWKIQPIKKMFHSDHIRSQRSLKILPYQYLNEFDASLYIDNSVLLKQKPEQFFEHNLLETGFCLPEHSFRESVLDEFLAVSQLGLDDQNRIFEQLNHYALDYPEVLEEKAFWTAILLRDHRNLAVKNMLEIWHAHVLRYSRRDQLSVNLAFRQAGLNPKILSINNIQSAFHSWPHTINRIRNKGTRDIGASLAPLSARVRQFEHDLLTQTQQNKALQTQHTQLCSVLENQKQHNENLQIELKQLHQTLAATLNSRSWKVVTLLRKLAKLF